jgi:purine-binding chemotaxis protein CheW
MAAREMTMAKANREPAVFADNTEAKAAAAPRLLCRSNRQHYAIPLENVVEIMRVLPIEALAGAPTYVRGLSVVRGAPVPVVDIGLLIGDRSTQLGRLVVIRTGGRHVALQVDTVLGIHLLDIETFGELPPLLRDVASDTVDAIGAVDEELLFALRATQLVPDSVFAEIDRSGAQS